MPGFPAPYTDLHNLNLDWILQVVKDFQSKYTNFDDTVTEALADIEAAKNQGLDTLAAAVTAAQAAAQAAILEEQAAALTAIATDRAAALAAIDTDKAAALAAIDTDKAAALSAIDTDKAAALSALNSALTLALTGISSAQNSATAAIDYLYSTLPGDSAQILGELAIINSELAGNGVEALTWLQGQYLDNDTTITADSTHVSSQILGGAAGRRLKIHCASGYQISEVGVWRMIDTVLTHGGWTPLDPDFNNVLPLDTVYFSIQITKTDYTNISPTDIPGNVTVEWPTNFVNPGDIASTELSSTAAIKHSEGNYFYFSGTLYQATADIASGGTITPGTNCAPAQVGNEIYKVKSSIYPYNAHDLISELGVFTAGTHNGVVFGFEGSTIIAVSGTATPSAAFINIIESINTLPPGLVAGKTYKIQFTSTNNSKLKAWLLYYTNGVNTSSTVVTENAEVTIPSTCTGIVIRYFVSSGQSVSNDSATLKLQSALSNSELDEKASLALDSLNKIQALWSAYIEPGYENTAKFETDANNYLYFSWNSNLKSAIGSVFGWTLSGAAEAVGATYTGTSPSGVENAIKIPSGYVFAVVANASPRTVSVMEAASFDRSKHLALVYNRQGKIVAGEMLKYYAGLQAGDTEVVCLMPSKLRICGGREMNIYHQNVIRYDNPATYKKIENTNRFSFGQYYSRYTPANDATGAFNSAFKFYKYNDVAENLKKTISVDLVPTTAGSGLSKKVLFIGDSMTDADKYPQEIVNLFADDPMSVTLLGTLGTTTAPNEGRSGWRAYTYCRCANGSDDMPGLSYTNPFYHDGHFDFSYYMGQQGYSGVDYVFICLGTNDVVASRTTHNSDSDIISYFTEMITSIHDYDSNIKIALWLPPVASQMVNYNRAYMDAAMRAHQLLIDNYDNRENEKIYLCPVYMNVDPFHDYPYTMQNVSARNSSFQEAIGTDNVHPSQAGYDKCADVIYSLIKYFGSMDA